ncbi:hypothetical protein HDU91_000096 [Kappamyces sp. JEL0680]|nr:hypothetical protein HDU91_000096 [Kappamyces sp. JEL0680]
MSLAGLGLSGSIPSNIANFPILRSLDLSRNNLRGPLPSLPGSLVSFRAAGNSGGLSVATIAAISAAFIVAVCLMILYWVNKRKAQLLLFDSFQADDKEKGKDDNYMRLQIKKKLTGRGGCGAVYLSLFSGKLTVAKIPLLREHQEMIYQEMEMLEKLASPWVLEKIAYLDRVDIYLPDQEDTQRRCALVLEYMNLGAMSSYLKLDSDHETTQPVLQERTSIAMQVAEGLQFMHSKGILHLDIKAGNVLLTRESDKTGKIVAKISDFGSCAPINSKKRVFQTPGYYPPESKSDGTKTSAFDVYAVGMLLIHMVARQNLPTMWHKENVPEAQRHRYLKQEIGVDPSLLNLILACTAKNPAERISIGQIIESCRTFSDSTWQLDTGSSHGTTLEGSSKATGESYVGSTRSVATAQPQLSRLQGNGGVTSLDRPVAPAASLVAGPGFSFANNDFSFGFGGGTADSLQFSGPQLNNQFSMPLAAPSGTQVSTLERPELRDLHDLSLFN